MSEDFIPMFSPKNIFTTEVRGSQHTYYLTGPITEPENYVDLCNILRSSGPQDEIIIRINSVGGSVFTERMICNAIAESEANVVGFIEYACMSAATTVFLACKQHAWGPHIQFMIHCAWWSSYGKTPDIKSHTDFALEQMKEEIIATYSGMLSEDELIQCNEGKEFWFGAKELERRMENFYEYQKSQPCDCGSDDCPQNQRLATLEQEENFEDMPSIDEMVEQAVTKALIAYDKQKDEAAKKLARKSKPKPVNPETGELIVK